MGNDMSTEKELEHLGRDAFQSMVKLAEYHRGNTGLLEVLMHVHGRSVDADARVAAILTAAGMLDAAGVLNWVALEARRDKPMTWQEAVRRFVADPATQERLLAMEDEPLVQASDSEGGETS